VNLSQATLAITGATGFLGGFLVDKLLARGARVIAVVRNPAKAAPLVARGVEARKADLAEPEALYRAFQGVDAVISNAAVVSFTKPRETRATNIEGTRNVFEAAGRAGVKRAIAISSTAAYPASPFVRDERDALRREHWAAPWGIYGASKAEAERVAWELCNRSGIALTTLRPCGITGAQDPLLMGTLRTFGRFPIAPFPVFTRIGVVHAEDVAEAVALALEQSERAAGQAYNLQGNTVSLWRVADALHAAGGPRPRLRVPIPFPFLLRYDDRKAREELGWKPRRLESIFQDAART
jgi:dihydroflavonol-4-reductase